jgi:RNA polymerase II subunit A small phosphatase-like protein
MNKAPPRRKLLIFDLDETLVCAREEPLSRPADFTFMSYHVYKRPFADALFAVAEQHYDFAVWSSASAPYVTEVAAHLFGDRFRLKFIWSVERCIQRVDIRSNGYVYIKDLRKVQGQGYGLDQITMLDDSPEKISRQPRNHLKVSPYFGSPNDNALADIAKVLAACHDVNQPGSLPGD